MSKETQKNKEGTNKSCLKTSLWFFLSLLVMVPLVIISASYIYLSILRPRAGTGVTAQDQLILDRFTVIQDLSTQKEFILKFPSNDNVLLIQGAVGRTFQIVPLEAPRILSWQEQAVIDSENDANNIDQLFVTRGGRWVAIFSSGSIAEKWLIGVAYTPNRYNIVSNDETKVAVITNGIQLYDLQPSAYPVHTETNYLDYPTNAAAWSSSNSSRLFFTTQSTLYSTSATGEQVDVLLTYAETVSETSTFIITEASRLFSVPNQEKLLLITGPAQTNNQIWVIDYQSQQVDLAFEAPLIQQVGISPDGSKLGFVGDNNITALDISALSSLNIQPINSIQAVVGYEPLLWTTDSEKLVFRLNDPKTGCANMNQYRAERGVVFPRFSSRSTKFAKTVCFFEIASWNAELQDEPTILLENLASEQPLANIISWTTTK